MEYPLPVPVLISCKNLPKVALLPNIFNSDYLYALELNSKFLVLLKSSQLFFYLLKHLSIFCKFLLLLIYLSLWSLGYELLVI